VRFRPLLGATIVAALACLSSAPATAQVRHSPGDGGTDVVQYTCETSGIPQTAWVRVELTMPTDARAGTQLVIGWKGAYDGPPLTAPETGLTGAKLYAYASISGIPGFTSATGVADLPNIPANDSIPLPQGTVELRSTPNSAGTATVKPGAINIGPSPTEPVIKCEVFNPDALRAYSLTVGGGAGDAAPSTTPTASSPAPSASSPAPSASATSESGTPTPSSSPTETATTGGTTGTSNRVVRTPVGSVATGGGGEAGPDARLIVLGGLLLTAAGTGGLFWRRVRPRRT